MSPKLSDRRASVAQQIQTGFSAIGKCDRAPEFSNYILCFPVLAQDRIFLAYPWTFLGEYELPKMNFFTPVGDYRRLPMMRRAIALRPLR